MKNRIISIVGGSGSGKSTLAHRLAESLSGSTQIISQDHYYKGIGADQNPETYNFDHPNALDLDRLASDLLDLKSGQPASIPFYDFALHSRIPEKSETVQPTDTIIVEGILLHSLPNRADVFDLQIYVESDIDVCLSRRIERDITERGRTVADVTRQFNEQVRPMFEQFVLPARDDADLVFDPPCFTTGCYEAQINELTEQVAKLLHTDAS